MPRWSLLPLVALLLDGCPAGEEPKTLDGYDVVSVTKSGTVIDCDGKAFNSGKITELQIVTKKDAVPSDITVRRCKITGSIRIAGLGFNGESKGVTASSITPGHTERAQAAAPTRITLSGLTITGKGRIPVYLSPGVTRVTLQNSTIKGNSNSVALYMDAESGHNTIRSNTFNVTTGQLREVIALDGSADNLIANNTIGRAVHGGIYLYRNCGEGGTVRHQAPQRNRIADNHFDLAGLSWSSYGIWLGSRNGNRNYCHLDDGYPFGSSIDNRDFADNNIITNNTFTGSSRTIQDDGNRNRIN